jgi:hypothetical protein
MKSHVRLATARDWRVIAQELANEHDSRRVLELSRELSAAIELRSPTDDHRPTPDHNQGAPMFIRAQNSVQMTSLLHSAIEASAADFGNIQLFDPANRALTIVAHCGFGEEFLSYYETVRFEDDCACAAAMRDQSRMMISNVATDPVFGQESRNVLLRANVRSVQSTPLVSSSGNLIGMLNTHYRRVDGPTPLVWKPIDELAAAFVSKLEVPGTA